MTESLLDNPIWNALRTDHAALAQGDDRARRYPAEIGPLAGIRDSSQECYESLRPLAGDHPVVLFSLHPIRPPHGWNQLRGGQLVQMIRTGSKHPSGSTLTMDHKPFDIPPDTSTPAAAPLAEPLPSSPIEPDHKPFTMPGEGDPAPAPPPTPATKSSSVITGPLSPSSSFATASSSRGVQGAHAVLTHTEIRQLTPSDAPAMVALADLTEPGPFRLRTIELGNFYGIFQDGRLVSMAGKRMHMPGFIEVSGVCTHPDARGHGYARRLMNIVIAEIEQAGCTPILHAWADNPALALYQQLGFTLNHRLHLAVLATN